MYVYDCFFPLTSEVSTPTVSCSSCPSLSSSNTSPSNTSLCLLTHCWLLCREIFPRASLPWLLSASFPALSYTPSRLHRASTITWYRCLGESMRDQHSLHTASVTQGTQVESLGAEQQSISTVNVKNNNNLKLL